MDFELLVNLVGSVGFPIAACIFMFNQNNKLSGTLAELSTTLTLMNERISNIENKIDACVDKKEV